MKAYRKLKVWEKSHQLVLDIYKVTKQFPKEELFGITSQLRRASVSILNNIAEGCGRDSDRELKRFLVIANGSANEVEYLLYLSFSLGYITNEEYKKLENDVLEIMKMITSFKNKIKSDIKKARMLKS